MFGKRDTGPLPRPTVDQSVLGARVGHALAEVEPTRRAEWENRFLDILRGFQSLPGGRIQAGAGTDREVPLFAS